MNNKFLNNKYTKWYYNIINNSVKESPYLEKHHIIPKSLGGDNSKNNLVSLTAKQHFICHLLLTKMTEGKDQSKMQMAAWAMASLHSNRHNNNRYKVNSRTFQILRENALTDSNRIDNLKKLNAKENNPFFGKTHNENSKQKMKDARKGKYTGSNNPFFGKKHSDDTKEKISATKKGVIPSAESCAARSAGLKEYYKSAEARQKTSDAMKKLCADPTYRARRGWAILENA